MLKFRNNLKSIFIFYEVIMQKNTFHIVYLLYDAIRDHSPVIICAYTLIKGDIKCKNHHLIKTSHTLLLPFYIFARMCSYQLYVIICIEQLDSSFHFLHNLFTASFLVCLDVPIFFIISYSYGSFSLQNP